MTGGATEIATSARPSRGHGNRQSGRGGQDAPAESFNVAVASRAMTAVRGLAKVVTPDAARWMLSHRRSSGDGRWVCSAWRPSRADSPDDQSGSMALRVFDGVSITPSVVGVCAIGESHCEGAATERQESR